MRAVTKLASIIFFCLFLAVVSAFSQPPATPAATPEISAGEVGIEQMYLAKDDGEGNAGEEAAIFKTTDIPIYCVVELNSRRPATVKMILVAVKVKGVKPETKVVATSFKTNGRHRQVTFTGSPDGLWIAGSYRADIFIDGRLAGSKALEIRKTVAENPAVEGFQPKPVKHKSAPPKRPRKNFAGL
jgi:hypothetical protein